MPVGTALGKCITIIMPRTVSVRTCVSMAGNELCMPKNKLLAWSVLVLVGVVLLPSPAASSTTQASLPPTVAVVVVGPGAAVRCRCGLYSVWMHKRTYSPSVHSIGPHARASVAACFWSSCLSCRGASECTHARALLSPKHTAASAAELDQGPIVTDNHVLWSRWQTGSWTRP